jgi:hypothetical protein
VAGFANGVYGYNFITEYNRECTVMDSNDGTGGSNDGDAEHATYETDVYLGGNCGIDVDGDLVGNSADLVLTEQHRLSYIHVGLTM